MATLWIKYLKERQQFNKIHFLVYVTDLYSIETRDGFLFYFLFHWKIFIFDLFCRNRFEDRIDVEFSLFKMHSPSSQILMRKGNLLTHLLFLGSVTPTWTFFGHQAREGPLCMSSQSAIEQQIPRPWKSCSIPFWIPTNPLTNWKQWTGSSGWLPVGKHQQNLLPWVRRCQVLNQILIEFKFELPF